MREQRFLTLSRLGRAAAASRHQRARERAITFLERLCIPERRSADGRPVGIQATLATRALPSGGMDLYDVLDAMIVDPATDDATVFAADPARAMWREIADMISAKLGFPLEPELFSNMLFVAHLGRDGHPSVRALCEVLLSTFREKELEGLFHFFASPKFACDIDCTGMAARARLVTRDIDLSTPDGPAELRRITQAILHSAAVCDVRAEENLSHGKENGPLSRHVFKVYRDDHLVQGAAFDRGLKINPVVVCNALYAVLFELDQGLRTLDEVIPLREYVEGRESPRLGHATVAEIVIANLRYATGHLLSGDWRYGCRYYPSPDAFLCFYSENVREYPALFGSIGAADLVRQAIEERRAVKADASPATDPTTSLNTAFRAIAASNVGIDAQGELDQLAATQDDSGAWTDFDCLYCFGSSTSIPVHFRSNILTTAFAIRALGTSADGTPADLEYPVSRGPAWTGAIIEGVLRPPPPNG